MSPRQKETACTVCGVLGKPGEYHPLAFCTLAKALGSKAARLCINEVLNHGRALEREKFARALLTTTSSLSALRGELERAHAEFAR